ncbi:Type 1 glutamine amidotransferase-like domain-containing protein [Kineococcus indalonis]|uniref:Type 1 glutamine amidotransferase-like domain-containing protein n=1 Tax=Kineococcus indalonis TaxID=2696566 RepID=UPI0014126901|nr:peptidase E [Kineococcus indalonis]NAZ87833.1 type 1 glutamine amidotransferase-like domain-containing protein [Kineococcus indalonis]
MPAERPTIVATSGGWRRGARGGLEWAGTAHEAVRLAQVPSSRRPRLTYLGTAGGDQRGWAAEVHAAGARAGFDTTVLDLFPMPSVDDVALHLLDQDVVWVGGGSVANLLAVWRVHGLDTAFRAAWGAGVVLGGVSAGSICWFTGGTTDSFGPELRAVTDGLGLLPYGNGVHYDSEERRRPLVHALVGDGTLGETHCTDDGVGLVYAGTELVEAVAEVDGKGAYVVRREGGEVVETRVEPRRLPS